MILLILCLTFALRVLPRLILGNSISSDGYFHLSMARAIRDNQHRIPETIPRVILPHRYTYPYLYHWLLAFLSEKNLLRFEKISGATSDTLYVFLSYLFAKGILNAAGFSSSEHAKIIALWTASLIAVSPALLRVGTGPRAYHGSPRPLGQLFFLIYMGSLVLFSLSHNNVWLFLSFIAAALIVITSKFTYQAAFFFGLLLCLSGNFTPLVTFIAGLLFAGIVTRGKAFRIVRTQATYSAFYFRYLQKRYLYPSTRGIAAYLRTVFAKMLTLSRPERILLWFFTEYYGPHLIVSSFPQVIVIIILLITQHGSLGLDSSVSSLGGMLGAWLVVSLAWMIITSFKPFLFLGEAVRYAENTVMPQILLLGLYVFVLHKPWILQALFIYSVIAYLMYVKIYYDVYKGWANIFDNFLPMLSKIDKPDTRIFGVGTFFWPLLYGTRQADILCPMSGVDTRDREFVYGNYPFPGVKIKEVVDKYQIDYLVGSESSIRHYEKQLGDSAFTLGEFTLIDSCDVFGVYSCTESSHS